LLGKIQSLTRVGSIKEQSLGRFTARSSSVSISR